MMLTLSQEDMREIVTEGLLASKTLANFQNWRAVSVEQNEDGNFEVVAVVVIEEEPEPDGD